MSTRLFLLLSVVAAIFQGSVLPPVFFEGILAVFLLVSRSSLRVTLALFLSGLVFDLFQNQTLGVTSLIFIVLGFLFSRVRERVPITRPEILGGLAVLVDATRNYFLFDNLISFSFLIVGLLAYLAFKTFWVPDRGGIRL